MSSTVSNVRGPRPARGSVVRAVPVVAAILGGFVACDDSPRSIVEGLGTPTIVEAADVQVVGTSELIATVQDLEVLPDGSVWVLNSVEPFFLGFGPDGGSLGSHGRRGGGPAEFRLPAGFVAGGIDGQAWVLDLRRHAVLEISRPDATLSELPIPGESIALGSLLGGMNLMGTSVRSARLGEEIILARSTGPLSVSEAGITALWHSIWGADLVALDRRTRAVRRVVGLGDALGDPISDFEFTEGGFPLWYRLWAVCGDGQIRVHDRLGNQVRRFASDGTELEPTALPPVNLDRVTPRQFGRAVFGYRLAEVLGEVGGEVTAADTTRVLNEIAQGVQGNGRELAAYLPRYVDFRCAADGTVWIQPFDVDRGGLEGGVAWLRITSDDVTDEIHFPERFDPYRFTTDRVWGVQRDEFDVASIAWIELPEDE